jgi:hypothetical protein
MAALFCSLTFLADQEVAILRPIGDDEILTPFTPIAEHVVLKCLEVRCAAVPPRPCSHPATMAALLGWQGKLRHWSVNTAYDAQHAPRMHRYNARKQCRWSLQIILDPSKYPLLVQCNLGRHRTGQAERAGPSPLPALLPPTIHTCALRYRQTLARAARAHAPSLLSS